MKYNIEQLKEIDIFKSINKYTIVFESFEALLFSAKEVFKVDTLKIEEILNNNKHLTIEDFSINFSHFLITLIIEEKLNMTKYSSERLAKKNQRYETFEIGYCKEYLEQQLFLNKCMELEYILDNDYDLEDKLFYDLINKHRNKELTYEEVMEIVNNK